MVGGEGPAWEEVRMTALNNGLLMELGEYRCFSGNHMAEHTEGVVFRVGYGQSWGGWTDKRTVNPCWM